MNYMLFREKLQDFLANKLGEREAALLNEHINHCHACSMILEDVKATFVIPEAAPGEYEVAIDGYTIVERLGKGGMGAVYRAVQISLGRDVALKILDKDLAENETLVARFEREARSAARLSHPNIVRVYDFGKSDEWHYISMEYIDGRTVFQIIQDRGRMDPRRALEIAHKVAQGLDHATESTGIIHRDIKPENIMIDSTGEIKIADMGLAKEIGGEPGSEGDITMIGERLGTPYYMSPEQIKETRSVDHRADIYSLGATLFHMVTGRRPFTGKTAVETMELVLEKKPEFTEEEKGFIPPAVRHLILEMIEKKANQRVQKWKQVVRRINGLLTTGLRGQIKRHS